MIMMEQVVRLWKGICGTVRVCVHVLELLAPTASKSTLTMLVLLEISALWEPLAL